MQETLEVRLGQRVAGRARGRACSRQCGTSCGRCQCSGGGPSGTSSGRNESLWVNRRGYCGPFSACPVLLLSCSRQELEHRHLAYVLEEMLGEGSYGRVYRARACADGRQVVAKARTGTDSLKHALAEAVALDRCRGHPRATTLLDVFMRGSPGQIHLVLEHTGRDLDQCLLAAGKDLAPGAARHITQHVASALQCLHGQGLLHADVKPANILVAELGAGGVAAKLGDFGNVMEALGRPSSLEFQRVSSRRRSGGGAGSRSGQLRLRPGPRPRLRPATRQ